VGGGITSALTTSFLAEKLPQAQISVWDKARGAGGRMATSRSPGNPQCKVDLGAQYISCSPENQINHQDVYEELISAGLLHHLNPKDISGSRHEDDGTKHYVTPQGMSSLVKHFFSKSERKVEFNRGVHDISVSASGLDITSKDGIKESFDTVVLTIPIPQVLDLSGGIQDMIQSQPQIKENLHKVEYSTRFALGLFYDEPKDLGTEWTATYISGHPIYRYIAIDNKKRGDASGPTSVVAHTSVPFGIKHIDKTPDSMKDMLLTSLLEMYPSWPQPVHVKSLKWKFSQVFKSYPGSSGCLVLSEKPLVILAGDAFTKSGLDGCIASAKSCVNTLINYVE